MMHRKRPQIEEVPLNYSTSYNLRGPAFFKLILPDKVTGSVIGRGGQVLLDLEHRTSSQVKVSPSRTFFPTTNERMVMISGELENMREIIPFILFKLQEHGMDPGNMMLRVIAPTTSIASIIGKGGEVIKIIQSRTGSRVHICERIDGIPEVIIELRGDERQVVAGAIEIMHIVQADPRIKDLVGQYYGADFRPPRGSPYESDVQERYTPPPFHPPPIHQTMHAPPPVAHPIAPPMMDPTSNPDLLMYPLSIQFLVPLSAVPHITGEENRALAQYFRDTGATVTVDENPVTDSNDVNVSITGPLCGVQAAHILVIKQVADVLMAQATQAAPVM